MLNIVLNVLHPRVACRETVASMRRFIPRYGRNAEKFAQFPTHQQEGRSLVVMLHGMYAGPWQFKKILDKLELDSSDVWIPAVKNRGKCPLDEAADAIFGPLLTCGMPRDRRIILVGISNGGRIAAEVCVRLRKREFSNVSLATLGAPLRGTRVMSRASHFLGINLVYPTCVQEELCLNSQRAAQLKTDYMETHKEEHDLFIAFSLDRTVTPKETCAFEDPSLTTIDAAAHTSGPDMAPTITYIQRLIDRVSQ